MIQQIASLQNPENVQEVSKANARLLGHIPRTRSKKTDDKTHVDFWKSRLFHNTYSNEGSLVHASNLSVKIQFRGDRQTFALKSTNREMAAREAKDIYVYILANGMAAAMEKFKPESAPKKLESPTIGQFLATIQTNAGLKAKTFNSYAGSLRKIAADIFKVEGGRKKFDYKAGGRKEWLQQVEAFRLAELTPTKVQQWKLGFLEKHSSDPARQVKAKRNVNSFIRQAKSLFSPQALRFAEGLTLPSPLPFTGVVFEKAGSMRYQSKIDHIKLVQKAKVDLAEAEPEQFKIFLLALGAGLRKAEIDTLSWEQVDVEKGIIWIGSTEHFTPKTEDSQGTVDVDPGILKEVVRLKDPKSQFVIASRLKPRPISSCQFYRCETEFEALNRWLRTQGVRAQKPLHELRKEFGSLICGQAGIFAASSQLRHADIRVTASYYLDKKEKVTLKLSTFLKGKTANKR